MKKMGFLIMILLCASCIQQTVRQERLFYEDFQFEDIWSASIRAVHEIGFTVYSTDKAAGFIGAESGKHIGQDAPPRISIMITETERRIYVDCRVLQKEQFIDLFGHGKRIARNFMKSLNMNLNRRAYH